MKILFLFTVPLGDISVVVLSLSLALGTVGTLLGAIAGVITTYLSKNRKTPQKKDHVKITITREDGSERVVILKDNAAADKILGNIDAGENF